MANKTKQDKKAVEKPQEEAKPAPPTIKNHHASPPKVKPHGCKSEYQDGRYGPGMRLMNPCAKGHRCSVCGVVV